MILFTRRTDRLCSFKNSGPIMLGIAGALMALSASPALAGEVDAAALAKCAKIESREARLICFDAVAEAAAAAQRAEQEKTKAAQKAEKEKAEAKRRAMAQKEAEKAKALEEAVQQQAETQQARREAEMAAREAELAKREAELARRQAEAEAQLRRSQEEYRAAQEKLNEARQRQEQALAKRDEEIARKDKLIQRNRELMANRLPQTIPILFGIGDLSREKAAKVVKGLDYEEIFAGEEIDRIELKVIKFGHANTGKAYVVLEDGQMWRQRDNTRVRFTREGPKTVEVKRGAVGSYFMRMDGRGAAIRAERLR